VAVRECGLAVRLRSWRALAAAGAEGRAVTAGAEAVAGGGGTFPVAVGGEGTLTVGGAGMLVVGSDGTLIVGTVGTLTVSTSGRLTVGAPGRGGPTGTTPAARRSEGGS
jgi:hypothetical protein